MASSARYDDRHADRPKRRWQDSLWAIGLLALAAGVIVRLAANGLSSWPSALFGAVAMAFYTPWLVRRIRHKDAAASGTDPDDVPALERQILKGAPPPQDPDRRRQLAALVDARQRRIRRNRWWAFPLMALLFFGTAALGLTTGSTTMGTWTLVLGIVFMTWLTWYNIRFDHRLTQMRRRLRS
jgi:fatty acid desaturase